MLDQDDPQFPNWDQDETAIAEQVRRAGPGHRLRRAARRPPRPSRSATSRCRPTPGAAAGYRSNGSEFTVESIGRLPPARHRPPRLGRPGRRRPGHGRGVRRPRRGVRRRDPRRRRPDGGARRAFAAAVGRARGCSRSAAAPVATPPCSRPSGVDVRRTDISPGFVDLLRARGHDADVLDPLTDDLDDPARSGHAVRRGVGERQPAPRRPRRPAGAARPVGRRDPSRRAARALAEGGRR